MKLNKSFLFTVICCLGLSPLHLSGQIKYIPQSSTSFSAEQFEVFEQWIKKQFQSMGCRKNAAELTMHLLVWTQGIATMAYIHQDTRLIQREVKSIVSWLVSLSKQTHL